MPHFFLLLICSYRRKLINWQQELTKFFNKQSYFFNVNTWQHCDTSLCQHCARVPDKLMHHLFTADWLAGFACLMSEGIPERRGVGPICGCWLCSPFLTSLLLFYFIHVRLFHLYQFCLMCLCVTDYNILWVLVEELDPKW